MSCVTVTFGDQAENHKGMQIIGKAAERGFSSQDLLKCREKFEFEGCKCEFISLNSFLPAEVQAQPASILVVRQGVSHLLKDTNKYAIDFLHQQLSLNWDSKAFMYGKVVNKHARYNLCYSDESQEPNYERAMGRIIPWKEVPILKMVKERLQYYLKGCQELAAEGNLYYDAKQCGIGFHGDSERKKVVALRLAEDQCPPLHYQWFKNGKPIGNRAIIGLAHTDLYVMSEKAVGWDWKKKIVPTLRHATGCQKFTKI